MYHSFFECSPFVKPIDDDKSFNLPECFFLLSNFLSSLDVCGLLLLLLLSTTSCNTSFTFDLFFKSMAFLDFNASERIVRRIRDCGPNSGLRMKSYKTLIHE